jgi:hypothetical protein
MPVIVSSVAPAFELLDAYAEAGAGHVTLSLPTRPEADTLYILDAFAELAGGYR